MTFLIPPPPTPSIAVAGSDARFAVRRIFCVARNYAAHAREMGADPDKELPFFFTKPADAVVDSGSTIAYPPETNDYQHEVELVVALAKGGANIATEDALSHIAGYAVGLDMTRRDLQAEAKGKGRPWDWAKGFDNSAPMSALLPVEQSGHPQSGRIWLAVDGEVRQQGDLSDMIWPVADIIALISRYVELKPGDLIMTGTPEGVSAVQAGQVITGGVDGIGEISLTIAP
ncbi:MAG: FAA hydrolase family protein [Sphingobium sp.]|nr:FAA hydrolase family protein [Sphingobium sp.]